MSVTTGILFREGMLTFDHIFTQEKVKDFANITGDHNLIHTDENFAYHNSPFKRCIVHGGLIISTIGGYIARDMGDGCIIASVQVNFRAPVFVGDPITCVLKIDDEKHYEMRFNLKYSGFNKKKQRIFNGCFNIVKRNNSSCI